MSSPVFPKQLVLRHSQDTYLYGSSYASLTLLPWACRPLTSVFPDKDPELSLMKQVCTRTQNTPQTSV